MAHRLRQSLFPYLGQFYTEIKAKPDLFLFSQLHLP